MTRYLCVRGKGANEANVSVRVACGFRNPDGGVDADGKPGRCRPISSETFQTLPRCQTLTFVTAAQRLAAQVFDIWSLRQAGGARLGDGHQVDAPLGHPKVVPPPACHL